VGGNNQRVQHHDLRQGSGWTVSFPRPKKKKPPRPNLSEAVRFVLKECRQVLCASQARTIVERELADRGGEWPRVETREVGVPGGICLVRVPGDGGNDERGGG
jgi:hypothetical protein